MDEEELLRLGYPIQGSMYDIGKELSNSLPDTIFGDNFELDPLRMYKVGARALKAGSTGGMIGGIGGLLPYVLPQLLNMLQPEGPGMWGSRTGGIMGIPQEQPSNFEEAVQMGMIPDTEWDQGGPVSVERPGYSRQSPASAGSRMRFTPPMRRIRGY